MTKQKETIKLTPVQLDGLFHDAVDLISRHGSFSGSELSSGYGDESIKSIELTACARDDNDLEIVATVYVRGKRLREMQEGGE